MIKRLLCSPVAILQALLFIIIIVLAIPSAALCGVIVAVPLIIVYGKNMPPIFDILLDVAFDNTIVNKLSNFDWYLG